MAEVKLRLNGTSDEVELVVDGEVALASGPEAFKSWVEFYNDKHELNKPVEDEPVKVEEPVEEKVVDVDEPVDNENED